MDSGTPIRNLLATKWLNGSLDAPWISTMTIKGDFGANINLSGEDSPKDMALKKATIAGMVYANLIGLNYGWTIDGNCGTITIASEDYTAFIDISGDVGAINLTGNKRTGLPATMSGGWYFGSVKTIKANTISACYISTYGAIKTNIPDIGNITVTGWITDDSSITSTGNIGAIKAGAMQNCTVQTDTGTIGRVEINGIRNEVFCYINSNITAGHFTTAYIAYPKYSNGGTPFGLTADSIDMLTIKDSASTQKWKNLDDPNETITIPDFKITLE